MISRFLIVVMFSFKFGDWLPVFLLKADAHREIFECDLTGMSKLNDYLN